MNERIIARLRPSTTGFETAYTVTAGQNRCKISHVHLANVSGANAKYTILHVLPGASNDEGAAIAWGTLLPGSADSNGHKPVQLNIPMHNIGETLVIKSSVANAINFMFYGEDLDS